MQIFVIKVMLCLDAQEIFDAFQESFGICFDVVKDEYFHIVTTQPFADCIDVLGVAVVVGGFIAA